MIVGLSATRRRQRREHGGEIVLVIGRLALRKNLTNDLSPCRVWLASCRGTNGVLLHDIANHAMLRAAWRRALLCATGANGFSSGRTCASGPFRAKGVNHVRNLQPAASWPSRVFGRDGACRCGRVRQRGPARMRGEHVGRDKRAELHRRPERRHRRHGAGEQGVIRQAQLRR